MTEPTQTTRYVVQVATKQGGSTRIVGDASRYDPYDPAAIQRLIATVPWLNEDAIASYRVQILRPDQRAWESLTNA